MKKEIEKEAYKLRFEYYNLYENKELKWHEKYKKHYLYNIVVESFNYKFHEIGQVMPKLLEKIKS
ncbi:hypothetical protein CP965_01920 [Halarcobacter mediterraneus]|uniref:Uncharacterized protein n=1 Tax=Halarcobacter mediterraneus TaxID=2023153 RepID=A0A4Q1AWX0_9BACT|nr:hypothetical protein [Halarcobacter mediterraneus]RXK14228.1 hypothetical protein CP965_01920 [Halarcobacter mediterraneus]